MITDGIFSSPSLDGAPELSLPLQGQGEYFATLKKRRYLVAPASFFNPILAQRTGYLNRALYSDDLTQSAWSKLSSDTIGTGGTDPEGAATLCKVKESGSTGAHGVSQALTVSSGPLNAGLFALAGERAFLRLRLWNATDGDLAKAVFNLATAALVSGAGSVKALQNGFCWCTVSGTATAANSTLFAELSADGTTFSYAGSAGSGLSLWRATVLAQLAGGPAILATAATRGITCPAIDTDAAGICDPLSFLVEESAPDSNLLGQGVARWERTFARVPRQTNVPSSVIVAKPDIPSTGIPLTPNRQGADARATAQLNYLAGRVWLLTGAIAFQPNFSEPSWELYSRADVTADSGPSFGAAPIGGTYTLTFRAQTTASINYNDTAGTVQTRLGALSSVTALGGVTVTGSYTAGFLATFATLAAAVANTGSLTGSAAIVAQTASMEGGYNQFVSIGGGISGGTYTVTILGQTTGAIAYNANVTTIATALNALSNVTAAGGVNVSGQGGAIAGIIAFQILFSLPLITGNAVALQPAASVIAAYSIYLSAYAQNLTLAAAAQRTITAPSHRIVAGDHLVIAGTNNQAVPVAGLAYFDVTAFSVIDANTLALTATAAAPWYTLAQILQIGARRVTGYQPAPINAAAQRITDYYLPGVSPGIVTAGDIPADPPQSDPVQFLAGCVSGETLNYITGDLQVWLGPILARSKSVVRVSDLGVTTINL